MPGFPDLPQDVRSRIYSHLDLTDLSRLSQVDKFLQEDVNAIRRALHKDIKEPHARSEEDVPPALRILDGFAGLLWFAANFGDGKDPVCVATALVRPTGKKKNKSGVLIAISNTGHLDINSLTLENASWKLSKSAQGKFYSQKALMQFYQSYQNDTSPMIARKLLTRIDKKWARLDKYHSALKTDIIDKIGKPQTNPLDTWDTSYNDTQSYLHAEMRILDLLWYDAVEPVDGKHVIIGISMLCCAHCEKAIRAFNQTNPKGWEVIILGGHGSEYEPSNWPGPRFLQDPKNEAARRVFFMYYEDAKGGFWATEEAKQGEDMRPLHGAK